MKSLLHLAVLTFVFSFFYAHSVKTKGDLSADAVKKTETEYSFQDSIKSLRETYPDYYIEIIDTAFADGCVAALGGIRVTNNARQSYVFYFKVLSDVTDTLVIKKEVYIVLRADYDANYFLKYLGITNLGDGQHTSAAGSWDYVPEKEIKVKLLLYPKNAEDNFSLLDAMLIN